MINLYKALKRQSGNFFERKLNQGAKSIARRLEEKAKKQMKDHKELWDMLSDYLEKTRSTGCQYSDYLLLYDYIRTNKPVEILECGTGVSTVIMAYALMENEKETCVRGRITSMEENKEWFSHAESLLPADLNAYVEIVFSPAIEVYYMFFRGMAYESLPDRKYDFAFIDGPTHFSDKDGSVTCDLDFIKVVTQSETPVSAIIDHRRSTNYVLDEIFSNRKVSFDYIRKLGFANSCTKQDLRSTSAIVASGMKRKRLQRFKDYFKGIMEVLF